MTPLSMLVDPLRESLKQLEKELTVHLIGGKSLPHSELNFLQGQIMTIRIVNDMLDEHYRRLN